MRHTKRVLERLYGPEFREGWGLGPWQGEPDRITWSVDEYHCMIYRHAHLGNLCGYVSVPPGHRLHGVKDPDLDCHGGITFSEPERHQHDGRVPSDYWTFGFDCAHGFDLIPRLHFLRQPGELLGKHSTFGIHETYRDVQFVTAEIFALIKQLQG